MKIKGKKIKGILKKRGIKPFTFAREIGIAPPTMDRILKGEKVNIDNLYILAQGLMLPMEDLIDVKGKGADGKKSGKSVLLGRLAK